MLEITGLDRSNPKDFLCKLDCDLTFPSPSTSEKQRISQTGITRKYSDFVWLRKELMEWQPECIVPPVPHFKFHSSIGSLSVSAVDDKVRLQMQEFLNRILRHPLLSDSPVLRDFLESGSEFAQISPRQKSSASKFFKSVSKSVRSVKEVDSWYLNRTVDIQSATAHLEKSLKLIEKVGKQRKGLSVVLVELATRISDMGVGDSNIDFSKKLQHVGTCLEKIGLTVAFQSDSDFIQLAESLHSLKKYAESAETTFDNRLVLLGEYDDACKNTLKKKQAAEKLRISSNVKAEKIEAAVGELNEAQNVESELKDNFKKISESLRDSELPHFYKEVSSAYLGLLRDYAKTQVEMDRKIMNDTEKLLTAEFAAGVAVSLSASTTSPRLPQSLSMAKIEAEIL